MVMVESAPTVLGCLVCGIVPHAITQQSPNSSTPRVLAGRCGCGGASRLALSGAARAKGSFVEQDHARALPGRLQTTRVRHEFTVGRDTPASSEIRALADPGQQNDLGPLRRPGSCGA